MEEDTEFKKLPVEERVVHKLWKARVHGYEELTKLFRQIDDEKSPEFAKYLGLVKKFVIDSNAVGQEKGLEATLAYVENYANAGKTVGEVMSGIVGKCIAAPKTKTRELAVQITLMYIEIEKQEAVLEELLKGTESKNPKIVAACISAITLALKEFGSKVINVKPLIKKMQILLSDRDKTVRDETKAMVVEIFRWIGNALRSQLANLQAVQVTELETEFAKLGSEKVTPTRYLRSQQEKQAKIAAEAGDVEDAAEDDEVDTPQEIDPYELVDPVNILAKLPADFYEKVEAKKWQERKEAVETVENLVKAPKLENGDYGDLVRALKKIICKDSNVVVVAIAGKCLAGLASGLKKKFQPYAGACVPALLEKFREKKQNVVLALREALDAIFISTTLEAIVEDVLEALNNKNPTVKAETAAFLARAFTKCQPAAFNKKMLKAYTGALLKTLNEPDPTVRDNSAEALGTAMKLVGEKAIAPFVVEVDNLKMQKIKECCEKAVITVKVAAPKKERAASAPLKDGPKAGSKEAKSVKRPTSAGDSKTKPSAAPSSTPAPKKKPLSLAKKPSKTFKLQEQEMTPEEVEDKALQIIDQETWNSLVDTNWKTRLAAVEKFQTVVQGLENGALSGQVLVGVLNKKPGLKDTNIQVAKCKLETLKIVAESQKFSTVSANLCINDVTDKLGDSKNSSLAADVLTAIAEATTLEHVSTAVLDYAFTQKSPKVQQESLLWLSNAIREFGMSVNSKYVIEVAKKGVGATNPGIRTAAITLLGTVYLFMGNTIHMFFQNEKPALKQQIDAEFNKCDNETPPQPTRGLSKTKSADNLDEVEEETEEPEPFKPEDLLPRVDISSQITEALINELGDKNWKVRNEALQKVETILKEARLIQPNIGDLPQALALRLVDSNGKIGQTSIQICQTLATAMGPQCKQHVRTLFPGLLQGMGDTKSWIRAAAITCINTWGDTCGYKEFFDGEMICDALKTGSPTLRTELWAWLAEKVEKLPVKSIPKEELQICIPLLFTNLEDRNADVRKNASETVLPFMIHLGFDYMAKQTEKVKPASKPVVMASLEKARPNLPVKPLPKSAKAAPEKPAKVQKQDTAKAPAKSRPSAAKAPTSRKKDDDVDTSPLLVVNNLKHQRVIDEQKLRVLKWNFTTPREEFVDLLKDQMSAANVNKTLMSNMFHIDFRYHLKAIESLTDDIDGNSAALISNLDLILKWLTLRFFDTNPSVLLKGLEYLQIVFNMLIQNKHVLLENEASSFIPYLILKVGDPKDAVRNGVKSLFKQIAVIYPFSRLFTYVMEGLKSKNARQRTECLEELATLIEGYGITVCQPSPAAALKEIAKHISDRDNSVRNAALNCCVKAYFIEGEKVYKMVGQISDKDYSLLEERIKRAKKAGPPPKPSRVSIPQQMSPPKTSPALSREPSDIDNNEEEEEMAPPPVLTSPSISEIPQTIKEEPAIAIANTNANETVVLDNNMNPMQEETIPIKSEPNSDLRRESPPRPVSGPFGLDSHLLQQLEKTPARVRIPQVLEMDLDFLDDPVPRLSEIYKKGIDSEILRPVVPYLRNPQAPAKRVPSLTPSQQFAAPRPMTSLVTNPRVGQELLLEKTINQIASPDLKVALVAIKQMEEILQTNKINMMSAFEDQFMIALTVQLKLLHSQNIENEEVLKTYRSLLTVLSTFNDSKILGKQVSRDVLKDILYQLINLLIDTKLERIQNNDAYNRVINLQCCRIIEKSDHTRIICALIKLLHDCVSSPCSPRFLELVMKCLWRIIKLLPTWADELDYDTILLEIHVFFKDFPTSWWKQKPSDTPSRTIKTLVHSMAKVKGNTLIAHLTKIQNPNESELQAYLLKILKTLKLEEVKQIPLKKEIKRPISRTHHNMLTEIFQKIGSKEDTKEGLTLLYDFKIQHPETDVQPYLERSSQFFQEYIEKGLKDIETSRKKAQASEQATNYAPNNPSTQSFESANIQPNQAGDAKASPDYWMNRLKMWQNVISSSSSTVDNKVSDMNENLSSQRSLGSNMADQDFDNVLKQAEELRKKTELLKQNM